MLRQINKLEEGKSTENTQVKASSSVSDVWLNEPGHMQKRLGIMQYIGSKRRVDRTRFPDKLKFGMGIVAGLLRAYFELRTKEKQQKYQAVSFQAYKSGLTSLISMWETR